MPYLNPARRPALQKQIRALKRSKRTCGVVGLLGIKTVVGIPVSSILGLLALGFDIKQDSVQRTLDDPARLDFGRETRIGVRRFDPRLLPDDPLTMVAGDLVGLSLHLAAALDAAVRADERAQGATRFGESEAIERQLETRVDILRDAHGAAVAFAGVCDALAETWRELVGATSRPNRTQPGLVELDLSLAQVSGLALSRASHVVEVKPAEWNRIQTDPVAATARALTVLARDSRHELARALGEESEVPIEVARKRFREEEAT